MKNLFLLFFLPTVLQQTIAYPFNSSKCTECIETFNNIHNHNDSIVKALNTFCKEYNISDCHMNQIDKALMTNSTKICEYLEICDDLTTNNFIFDTDPYDIKIFRYYDLLIGFKLDMSQSNIMNFTKKWSIKLAEPFKTITTIPLQTPYDRATMPYIGCDTCNLGKVMTVAGRAETDYPIQANHILKVNTNNYVYYINITDGIVFDRLTIKHNRLFQGLTNIKSPSTSTTITDSIYNGTMFISTIAISSVTSQCNWTDPLSTTGTVPTLENCIYSQITGIDITEWGVDIPKQPPRCGTALEMYCPHSKLGRSDCLRCIVINQKLLATCNSFDEENWCENNN